MAQGKSRYAQKHELQLRGVFNEASPLPTYRTKEIKLSNGMSYKIKFAV